MAEDIEIIKELTSNDTVLLKRRKPFLGLFVIANNLLCPFVDWKSPTSEYNKEVNKANKIAEELTQSLIRLVQLEGIVKNEKKYIEERTKGSPRKITNPETITIDDKKDYKFVPLAFVPEPKHTYKEIVKPEIIGGQQALGVMAKFRAASSGKQGVGTTLRISPDLDSFRSASLQVNGTHGEDGVDDVILYKPNQGGENGKKKGGYRKKRSGESNNEHQARLKRIDQGNPLEGDMDEGS